MPPSVRNWDGVIDITARIARAFRVVNLSSLLHTDAVGQPPTRAFRPAGVRQYLEGGFEGPGHQLPGVRVVEHDRPAQVWEQANLPPVAAEAGTTAAAWQAAAEQPRETGLIQRIRELRDEGYDLMHAARMAREELHAREDALEEVEPPEPEEDRDPEFEERERD
jgi:hypothetical protein